MYVKPDTGYREARWPLWRRYRTDLKTIQPHPLWQEEEYFRQMQLPPPAAHEQGTPAAIQWEWRNKRDGDPLVMATDQGLRRKAREAAGTEGPRPKRRGGKVHA
jgi:hypothetical protein